MQRSSIHGWLHFVDFFLLDSHATGSLPVTHSWCTYRGRVPASDSGPQLGEMGSQCNQQHGNIYHHIRIPSYMPHMPAFFFLLLDSILLAIFKRNYAFLVSQCNECWKECSIDAQSPWATIDRRIYSRILILGCLHPNPPSVRACAVRHPGSLPYIDGNIPTSGRRVRVPSRLPQFIFLHFSAHLCPTAPAVSWNWLFQQNVTFDVSEGFLWSRSAVRAGSVFTTKVSIALLKKKNLYNSKWHQYDKSGTLYIQWLTFDKSGFEFPSFDFKSLRSTLTSCFWDSRHLKSW